MKVLVRYDPLDWKLRPRVVPLPLSRRDQAIYDLFLIDPKATVVADEFDWDVLPLEYLLQLKRDDEDFAQFYSYGLDTWT